MAEQLSLDEQASALADKLFAKSGQGDMPKGRAGRSGAEGGFTPDAGGRVIDADAQKGEAKEDDLEKGATGDKVTNEPKADSQDGKTGEKMSSEPKGEGEKKQAGKPGLSQDEDESTRKRKEKASGKPGEPSGVSLNEDESTRKRAGMVKGGKACKSEDEMGEEEKEEKEEEKDEAEKSFVDASDLFKSLDELESLASGTPISKEKRLEELSKSLAAGELTKAEMIELAELQLNKSEEIAAEDIDLLQEAEEVEKSFQEEFADDEELKKGYDVSSFLERQSQLSAAAMDELRKSISDEATSRRAYSVQLAKSLRGMVELTKSQSEQIAEQSDLIKSLQDRLEVVENTPLPRKGAANINFIQKSLDGEAGQNNQLNRNQILDSLEKMAMEKDVSASGAPLMSATALYEQTGQISKSLYNDVVEFNKSHRR